MRYPASKKLEIIRTVEKSHLSARQTLDKIGVPRPAFISFTGSFDRIGGPSGDSMRMTMLKLLLAHNYQIPKLIVAAVILLRNGESHGHQTNR